MVVGPPAAAEGGAAVAVTSGIAVTAISASAGAVALTIGGEGSASSDQTTGQTGLRKREKNLRDDRETLLTLLDSHGGLP